MSGDMKDFRQRLLDALEESIAEDGYPKTTVADIVRRARTSRRTFYEHFDSREACFVALLSDANADQIRQISEAVDPSAPWQKQVRQAIAGIAYADPAGSWSFTTAGIVNALVLQVFGLLLGFGLAALILNTPGAIVAYFALPTALALVTELVPWFKDHLGPWVDTTATNAPFQSEDWASGGQWARLLVSALMRSLLSGCPL